MAERIEVTPPAGEYDILIESGLLRSGRLAERAGLNGTAVIVTNTTVEVLYRGELAKALPGVPVVTMGDGEQFKSLETVAQLYIDFVAAGLDRSGTVIAFGGGVVGDAAGFAAATYLRGVRLVQMPTSLLSMVDSSVGSKVGVDLPQGKNLVGAFKHPDAVLIDPDVLATLPERTRRCGMGEVIKDGLLADERLLDEALWQPENVVEMIRRSVQVKMGIVQADPFEENVRAYLNLGHTFAHAIEQVSHYEWPHGEAVGFGLVAAARLSHALKMCDSALAERVEKIVEQAGLPTRLGGLDPESIYEAMGTDKKWRSGRSRFVLLRGVCQPEVVENVPIPLVIEVLESLR